MPRLILRQIFSASHEVPWMKMAIRELESLLDEVIITESAVTHTGLHRKLEFKQHVTEFEAAFGGITYVPITDGDFVLNGTSPADLHRNETEIRGAWAREFPLRPDDIVIAVDADEVISADSVKRFTRRRLRRGSPISLRLHQFFWSPSNLWIDANFVAPTIASVRDVDKNMSDWRYLGATPPGVHGWHFSWCLTVEQMMDKLERYSHSIDFSHLRNPEIMTNARAANKYIFDEERAFTTRFLDLQEMEALLPQSYWEFESEVPLEVRRAFG